jgi:hypothetical protein
MSRQDNELEQLARQLHEEWDSPSLWPRIQNALEVEQPVRKHRPLWSLGFAFAAILVLTVALARLLPKRPQYSANAEFLTRDVLLEVERNEAAYVRSIEKLSAIASSSLEASPAPLAAAYREKLVVLDSAIAELKAQMEGNQYNNYLRNQLASLYREKQATLEEWLKNAKGN